jgi:sulfur-oxidizing protein SoxX
MKQRNRIVRFFLYTIMSAVLLSSPAISAEQDNSSIAKGKELAFERKKGNCLACHAIEGGDLAGTIGPPLIVMKSRYPDRETMRAKIWDATQSNPQSVMPPFGKNRILSDEEIEHIINFVYSL